jgi:dolichol-phosphate mannosyltransferase
MKKISVIVPVYYNEKSLPSLFEELRQVEGKLQDMEIVLELIFVDDGSGDGSLRELLKIKEQRPATRIIQLSRNFGAVSASKTGLQFVTGDCFMYIAADLQDPPSLILEMVDRWRKGAKFIICVRTTRDDPFLTKLFAKCYYLLLRFLVVRDYPEGGFDLALMDKALLAHMRSSSKNINNSLFAFWLGFKPDRIFYERRKRLHGKSRWTFAKKFKYFVDTMLGFSILPLRVISMTGIFVSLLSGGYGLFVLWNALLGNYQVPGFATLAILLTFLLGLLISMLGVIGEYIWRIFDEISRRPEAVISEIY